MKETSESEDNETGNFSGEEQNAPLAGANHRAEREQKLRDMMDDEGEFCISAIVHTRLTLVTEDTAESPAEVSQATSSKPEEPAQEEQETVTSNGRRRGKRKVMKKKTMQDAEGYLSRCLMHHLGLLSDLEPQSRRKKRSGSRSQKKTPSRLPNQGPRCPKARALSLLIRRGRATSCRSLARSRRIHLAP